MDSTPRKQSPRVPSMPLDESITRAAKVYKEEGRHQAPVEVVMKHIGYAGASGTANRAVASLRYWGLVERVSEGTLVVTKEFESYLFAPEEQHKKELLIAFLRKPPLIAELLDNYKERLPSDASIRFALIQKGFTPDTAGACLNMFKRSLEFANYYGFIAEAQAPQEITNDESLDEIDPLEINLIQPTTAAATKSALTPAPINPLPSIADSSFDRIPVRLDANRRAWLEIPNPLYKADVERLKQQIDFLLTDD
jgi:hypothetical protein